MQHTVKLAVVIATLAISVAVSSVHATQLTFNIYTNAAKTDPLPNSTFIPASYGDNVTDFEPAGAFGPNYYSYGTNGGVTPAVTVTYGWFLIANPTNSFGTGFADNWDFDYNGLTNVVFPAAGLSWYTYISFTSASQPVRLDSFDYARYLTANVAGQTLKVVKNQLSANPLTLWSAGPDLGVTAGLRTNYTPNVVAEAGDTIFLVFGTSGNTGLDNITFSQVPEPSSLLLMGTGFLVLARFCARR